MLEEILYNTSLIAAEATYEINPCERIEKWWDSIIEKCNTPKNDMKNPGKFLGKFWVNWVNKEPNK